MPEWSNILCNLYWMLRYRRAWDDAHRRRYYRYIAKEKLRLIEEARVDPEELRLLCRYLSNPQNRHAERRWKDYVALPQKNTEPLR